MDILSEIVLMERRVAELAVLYEHYFSGREKRPPLAQLDEASRFFAKYRAVAIINTAARFRFDALTARFVSYKRLWERKMRMLEAGQLSRGARGEDALSAGAGDAFAKKALKLSEEYRLLCVKHGVEPVKVSLVDLEKKIAAISSERAMNGQCVDFSMAMVEGKASVVVHVLPG